MKKFSAAVIAAAMVLSLAACGGSQPAATTAAATEAATEAAATEAAAPAADAPAELKTVVPGKLTVATSPDFAPYEFYSIGSDGKPSLAGFDMALAKYIAEYMGLELEIIPMDFDGTIMELAQGNVDLSMAGYSPSPDRLEVMDFSDIYIMGTQSFVCHKDNVDKFPTLEAANNPDFTIGAQVGSIQADLAKKNTPDADIIEMSKVTDLIAELISGKMDGAFIETMVAESYALSYPEISVALDVPYDSEGSVVGVSKGNTALLNEVNAAIKQCIDSGAFAGYVVEANELASGDIIEGLIE